MLIRKSMIAIGAAATFLLMFACWRLTGVRTGAGAADGVVLTVFSMFACLSTAAAARSSRGARRLSWCALAVGLSGWVYGNLIWLYFIVQTSVGPPFPSPAEYGFLLLPVAVVLAALSEVTAGRVSALRPVLDGVIIAAALFLVVWPLGLHEAVESARSGLLADAVKLAFPISDVVIVTMTVLTLSSVAPGIRRRAIAFVGAGLIVIAVTDSAWIYQLAPGSSLDAGTVIGWSAGLLMIGAAGLLQARRPPGTEKATGMPQRNQIPSRNLVWLPYLPLVLAVTIGFIELWPTPGAAPILIAVAVLVFSALARQFIVLLDNRRLLRTVAEQARRDPLTGLGNRWRFEDHLKSAMRAPAPANAPVAVLALDLDDFKLVNDNLGHAAGDALLVEVAERLTRSVPAGQIVARVGGDEFAILIRSTDESAEVIAQSVIEAFDAPFVLKGEDVYIHPSVGLAVAPDDEGELSGDELLQRADVALYGAKRSGIGGVQTFSADLGEHSDPPPAGHWPDSGRIRLRSLDSLQLLGQLRRAIAEDELQLVYQPKVSLVTGAIVGVEALVRWPHPELGLLPPGQFLPLVRRNGLIGAVTDLVLARAVSDASSWYATGTCEVPVAINLFAPSLSDIGLDDRIRAVLAEHGLPAEALVIEITEHLLLANIGRTQAIIDTLRASGLRVSIDDFGTGYSMLSYLRDLTVDEVKLDRQLVAPILRNERAAAIVRSMIDLTHALNIVSVAEGVENAEIAQRLRTYGCDVAQGYYFAAPMFADELRAMMKTGLPSRT